MNETDNIKPKPLCKRMSQVNFKDGQTQIVTQARKPKHRCMAMCLFRFRLWSH